MRGTGIRKPILAAALAGVVVIVALLVWYLFALRPSHRTLAEGTRTNVLLIGSAEGDGHARELSVMSWTGDGTVSFLIVPDEISIKLDDGTLDEIGAVYAREGVDGTCEAICALLGIELHGALACSEEGFLRLIDEVGGLPLILESDVVYSAPGAEVDGQIEIRSGEQMLGGTEALAYLRGESDIARPIRERRLLQALIERGFAGRESRSIKATIRAVYPYVETDLPLSALDEIGIALGGIDPASLRTPIVPSEAATVDGVRILQPRVVETERLVATLVRGLELLTPSEVRVAVFNGNGVRLMASRTAEYLRARGFEVTRIANAESFAYSVSYIVVLTDEAKAWVLRDALPSEVKIVYPDAFEDHYEALVSLIPFGTDLLLIAGAGMDFE
ncbi:LCP family protein [Candidatus Bipolaricaulota bacterium]